MQSLSLGTDREGLFRRPGILGNSLALNFVPRHQQRPSATMSAATADSGDDEVRSRNQQPMLASQRHKAGNDTPTEENRTGRFGNYFTLGYKEGFSQWVCMTIPQQKTF